MLYAICLALVTIAQPAPEPAPPAAPPESVAAPEAEPAPPSEAPEEKPPASFEPPAGPAPFGQFPPESVEEAPEAAPEAAGAFPCDRLEYLWTGPFAGNDVANNGGEGQPRTPNEAALVYAEYFRYLFLSPQYAPPCEVRQDPLITVANAAAALARGRAPVNHLAGVIASSPETVNAVWLLDGIIRNDLEYAAAWQYYFGGGPAVRLIDLLFDELPRGSVPVYQALLRLTETAQGAYADRIAGRFIGIFANSPQWVLLNAERLVPFAPALRLIFCSYLSVPERETLVLRYGAFPYSDAQVAVIELIACL